MNKKEINKYNGEVLATYRYTNNLSGTQVAKRLQIHPSTYYKYENGIYTLSKNAYDYFIRKGLPLEKPIFRSKIDYAKEFGTRTQKRRTRKQKIQHILHEKNNYKSKPLSKRTRVYVHVIQNIDYLTVFGKKLKDIRMELGYTLEQMSSILDLSLTHLWKLEQGEAITLRVSTLVGLINLGVSLDDLFGGLNIV